jgi:hypothetical protein
VHPKMCPIVRFCLHALGFGGKGIRTPDFQLAKLALYQLSYAPVPIADSRLQIADCKCVASASCHEVSKRLLSERGTPATFGIASRAVLGKAEAGWRAR